MTYAHLMPRAGAGAGAGAVPVAGVCVLQKPCRFLIPYKNTRHPLHNRDHNRNHNRNHINHIYTSTPSPIINSSSNRTTDTPANMPTYIVRCKDDATPEHIDAAKKHAEDQGGKIGHSYNLIKGFSVDFPEDSISTLENHEHVKAVEKDQVVKTQ